MSGVGAYAESTEDTSEEKRGSDGRTDRKRKARFLGEATNSNIEEVNGSIRNHEDAKEPMTAPQILGLVGEGRRHRMMEMDKDFVIIIGDNQ